MRCLLLVLTVAMACSDRDSVNEQKCRQLRDHLIDLRLASVTGSDAVDLTQHRAAMQQALGDTFLDDCQQHMTIEQLRCNLKTTDLSATKDCVRAASR